MLTWEEISRVQVALPGLEWIRPDQLDAALDDLMRRHGQAIRCEPLGQSFEGRPIRRLFMGTGSRRILLWSQMHGDEPTHTEVLLRMMEFLARHADHPSAASILEACELCMVPMLNPDGAHQGERYNAQGIDINRDALQLQTPEGRLLHKLVSEWEPALALTLHNQNHRTPVQTGGAPASMSLLAPPATPDGADTPSMVIAKQVAGKIIEAVWPKCQAVSRYDADYMPRCFGEWVQARGTSALLVEAGGTADADLYWLSNVHLMGILSGLAAYADGSYEAHDTSRYESVPRSSDKRLFDCLVTNARMISPKDGHLYQVDVGINFEQPTSRHELTGRVDDLGDLHARGGIRLVDAGGLHCRPGTVRYAPELDPTQVDDIDWASEFARGVTTLVGGCRVADKTQREALARLPRKLRPPGNLAFLGVAAEEGGGAALEACLATLVAGTCGLVTDNAALGERLRQTGLRCFDPLPWPPAGLKLDTRTSRVVRRSGIADLVFHPAGKPDEAQLVMVNGVVVWQHEQLVNQRQGRLLLGNRHLHEPEDEANGED